MFAEQLEAERQRLLSLVRIKAVRAGDDWVLQLTSPDDNARLMAYWMVVYLPRTYRSYHGESHSWRVSLSGLLLMSVYWPEVSYLCSRALDELEPITEYESPEEVDEESDGAEMPSRVAEAFAALHLDPSAPFEVVQAAWRALAKKVHPDAGGDAEKMKQLNLAYEVARNWSEG